MIKVTNIIKRTFMMKTLVVISISMTMNVFAQTVNLSTGESYSFGNKTVTCNDSGSPSLPPCVIFKGYSVIMVGCSRLYNGVFTKSSRVLELANQLVGTGVCSSVKYEDNLHLYENKCNNP